MGEDRFVRGPDDFTVTRAGYDEFVRAARLRPLIAHQVRRYRAGADLVGVGVAIRTAFCFAEWPAGLRDEIAAAYRRLGGDGTRVVVRGGTAPEVFENIDNGRDLLAACRRCFAAQYTDEAIRSRENGGGDHLAVTTSVEVRRMVRPPSGQPERRSEGRPQARRIGHDRRDSEVRA
jgi:phosphoenolpyruvate synthase/pyruvate phosphate dikinase